VEVRLVPDEIPVVPVAPGELRAEVEYPKRAHIAEAQLQLHVSLVGWRPEAPSTYRNTKWFLLTRSKYQPEGVRTSTAMYWLDAPGPAPAPMSCPLLV
jgi:hypothetical protein